MKNMKRAYRRHKQHVKFLKRLKKWICSYKRPHQIEIEIGLAGKGYTFLRTTGSPCNCYCCQYYKYKRMPKHKWAKEIIEQINENK